METTQIFCIAACRFPFEQRAQLAQCPLGKQLFELMAQKRTNLAVAADVPTAQEMLQLADLVRTPQDTSIELIVIILGSSYTAAVTQRSGLRLEKEDPDRLAAMIPASEVVVSFFEIR